MFLPPFSDDDPDGTGIVVGNCGQGQLERLQKKVIELQLQRSIAKGHGGTRGLIIQQILALTEIDPDGTPQTFADALKVPLRTVQRYVTDLVRSGTLIRQSDGWQVAKAA